MQQNILAISIIISSLFLATSLEVTNTIPEQITFTRKNFNKDNPTELFKLFVSYPEADGIDEEDRHEINLGIQQVMTQSIADFKEEMRTLQSRSAELTYGVFNFDYLVTFNSDQLVSVQFQKDIDFGDRYGKKTHILTFNYNLSAKRRVHPNTIFSKEASFGNEIYNLLKGKAQNFKPDPKRMFDKFTLTNEYLVFYFDETNSNTAEINEIRLLWLEVQHLLSEKSDGLIFK